MGCVPLDANQFHQWMRQHQQRVAKCHPPRHPAARNEICVCLILKSILCYIIGWCGPSPGSARAVVPRAPRESLSAGQSSAPLAFTGCPQARKIAYCARATLLLPSATAGPGTPHPIPGVRCCIEVRSRQRRQPLVPARIQRLLLCALPWARRIALAGATRFASLWTGWPGLARPECAVARLWLVARQRRQPFPCSLPLAMLGYRAVASPTAGPGSTSRSALLLRVELCATAPPATWRVSVHRLGHAAPKGN